MQTEMLIEARAETAPQKTKMLERISAWLAPLAGALIFLPTLWYGFVWDDAYAIVGNASLRSWKTLAQVLWGPLDPTTAMYRPITSLVIFFQFRLFGVHPWGYHLTSLLLHALACALVYRVALRLSQKSSVALFASLLFAVHAAHLEAIAWVSALAEPMVASAVLVGILCYLRYREARETRWLAATCLSFFAGLLIKETAIILPLLLLAYEFSYAGWSFRILRKNLPIIAGLSCTGLVYVTIRHFVYTGFIYNESKLPFSTLIFTWPSLLLGYCRHLLAPTPLSPFYDSSYVTAANAAFWLPLLALAAIAAAAYFASRMLGNGGLIRFCILAMAISIIPVLDLNIFQFREIMHDRFLYIPSVFFALLAGHLLFGGHGQNDLHRRPSGKTSPGIISVALAASLVLLNIAALLVQSPAWQNDLALMSYAVRIAPNNPRPAFSLALTYLERGELSQAERTLQHVVQIAPAPRALFMLGETRLRMGDAASAEQPLRQAIAVAPDRPGLHFTLGECLQMLGRTDDARAEFKAEASIASDYREAALQRLSQLQTARP